MLKKEKVIEDIKEKYGLKDTSVPELERGLRKAAVNNQASHIEYFIKVGVDIDAVNNQNKTALHFAIERENDGCVKELLRFNADYNIKDTNNDTALCLSAKSKNIKIRTLLFERIAQDAFKKIKDKYMFLPTREGKITDQNAVSIYNEIQKDRQKEQDILDTMLMALRYYLDPNGTNPASEKYNLVHLSNFFRDIIFSHKYRCKYANKKLYNYCQLLCEDLAFQLFRFNVFFCGKISLHLVHYKWPEKNTDHAILLINVHLSYEYQSGKYEIKYKFTDDSVLCNPLHEQIFVGETNIAKYLNHKIYLKTGWSIVGLASNIYPNFEALTTNKDMHKQFIKLLQDAYFQEADSYRYVGAIYYKMESFFYSQYIKDKLILNSFIKHYKISEAAIEKLKMVTEKQPIAIVKIQSACKGFFAKKQRKALEKEREKEIKEYVCQLVVNEKYAQAIELINTLKNKQLDKATQIISKNSKQKYANN